MNYIFCFLISFSIQSVYSLEGAFLNMINIMLEVRNNVFAEGSFCHIHDGSGGRCTVDRSCKWALENLAKRELKANQLVRCGLKGTSSIICCKDETLTTEGTQKTTNRQTIVDGFVFK